MHESGMIEDLLKKVEEAARANGANKVVSIDLLIGALAGIEAEHLREHFVIASAGTLAEGAELRIKCSDEPTGVLLQSLEVET